MKQFYTVVFLIFLSFITNAQQFHVKDLLDFTSLSVNKFDAFVAKKDYKRDYYSPKESGSTFTYLETKKKNKDIKDPVARNISFQSLNKQVSVCYQTSSIEENQKLKEQLNAHGFRKGIIAVNKTDESFYQFRDFIVNASIEIKDSVTFYTYLFTKALLPRAKEIVFAEELLPYTSHEYLVHAFGEEAVKKDVFYYSEKETNKCSVLFPNTPREVIFIWEDEKNYKGTAFLMIGGHLQTNSSSTFNRQIQHNNWRSNQGVYSGMTLKELQALNESPINFYNWQMEQAGMLAPKNTGKVDFSKIGLILNCLNCGSNSNVRQASIINSESQLAEDKKIYVSTIIILPEKEKPATASR
jgi:hypothetical protein